MITCKSGCCTVGAILAFDASSRVRLSTLVYRYVGNGLRDELRRQYRSVRAVCVDDVYAADTVPPYDARLAESEFEMVRLRCVSIAIDRLSSGERSILDSYRTGERLRDVGSRLGLSRQDVSQQRKVVAARVRDAVQNMERAR